MHLVQHGLAFGSIFSLAGVIGAALPPPVDHERFTELFQLGSSLMSQITIDVPNPDYTMSWDRWSVLNAGWTLNEEVVPLALRDTLNALVGWSGPQISRQTLAGPKLQDFLHDSKLSAVSYRNDHTGDQFRFAHPLLNKLVVITEETVRDECVTEQQEHPDIVHLSDLVNIQWCRSMKMYPKEPSKGKRIRPPPAYYLFKAIRQPEETLAVMHYCLHKDRGLDEAPVWPDAVTFPFGTYCFDALLATKNAQSVAWMLINYPNLWSGRVLTSVLNFRFAADGEPSMMWTVNKANEQAAKMLRENTQAETQSAVQGGGNSADIPHAMLGKYDKPAERRTANRSGIQDDAPGVGSSSISRRAPPDDVMASASHPDS